MVEAEQKDYGKELIDAGNLKLKAIWKEIQELIDSNSKNDKIDFNNIITENFCLTSIEAGTALKCVNEILKDPKYQDNNDLKMLQKYLMPIANPMWDYTMPDENNDIGVNGKVEVNRDLKQQIKWISKRIKSILENIPADKIGLIQTLNWLQNILTDMRDINPKEMDQIKRLINVDYDTSDTEVFSQLSDFIQNIDNQVNNLKSHTDIVNEFGQSREKFSNFCKAITEAKYSSLDEFNNSEDIKKIQFFIENNPSNEQILDLYLLMKKIRGPEGKLRWDDVRLWDRWAFNKIFSILEKQYWNWWNYHENVQIRFLDDIFSESGRLKDKSLIDFCRNTLKWPDWDWTSISENDKVTAFCKTWGDNFTEQQFIKKFNDLNDERRNNNVEALKWVDIIRILKEQQWSYILDKINRSNDIANLTIKLNDVENPVKLDEKGLLDLIWDYEFTLNDLPEWKWVFIDDEELRAVIDQRSDEIISGWLQQIANRPLEESWDANWLWGKEGEVDIETPAKINAQDIESTRMRWKAKKVTPEDVVTVVNNAIDSITEITDANQKNEMINKIKTVIDDLKDPWSVIQGWGQTKIIMLQEAMKNAGQSSLELDWKFGPKTFNAMNNYLKVELSATIDEVESNDPDVESADNGGSVETIVNYKQEALNLLKEGLVLPWINKIRKYIKNWDKEWIQLIQLNLLPAYTWNIDWAVGPKTLSALQKYINEYKGTEADDMRFLSMSSMWNPYEKNIQNYDSWDINNTFVSISNWTNYKVYFQDWAQILCNREVATDEYKHNYIKLNCHYIWANKEDKYDFEMDNNNLLQWDEPLQPAIQQIENIHKAFVENDVFNLSA